MHDTLCAHQPLGDQHFTEYPTSLRVPASEVKRALAQHVYLHRVREGFMSGVCSDVKGTPTFLLTESVTRLLLVP